MRHPKTIFVSMTIIIVAALTVSSQNPVNHGGKIETKYDGFTYETVMRLHKMKVTCSGFKDYFKDGCISIDVTLHCPGIQLNYVRSVTLQVIFDPKNWDQSHSIDQRDLSVVADTETLRIGRMRLLPKRDSFKNDAWTETLEATVPYKVFKKMVRSESVELQVGPSSFELRDKNIAALRDLDSRILQSQ